MDLRREAVGLQKAAKQKLGVKPVIKTGGRGDMIVLVDGVTVFDHKKDGPWPGADEMVRRISAHGTPASAPPS
jgi:predicted Rdx family selenoprotein